MRRQPPSPTSRPFQDQKGAKSRTHVGQIISVDTLNGRVVVRSATSGEEFTLQIPLGGFSINGLTSSWDRYMPQRNDYVKIGFGPDNSPELMGYAAFGDELDPSGNRQGSIAAPRQGYYATVRRAADADPNGLGLIFRQLKEGEWDKRSSGGAYILGTQDGTLTLAGGGGADIRLIKERQEAIHTANLDVFNDNGVEVRFGLVKRLLPPVNGVPSFNESEPIIPNPGAFPAPPGILSTNREHRTKVQFLPPPAGIPALTYYDEAQGTVYEDIGTPAVAIPSPTIEPEALVPFPPSPLRSRSRWYALDGLIPSLEVDVDFLGNVQVQQLPTAPIGLSMSMSRLFLHAHTSTATLAATLPTASVFLGSEGALLSAAPVPGALGVPQAYVLGTAWGIADTALEAVRAAQNGVEAGALATLAAATATFLSGLAAAAAGPPPFTNPDVLKLVPLLTTLVKALGAAAAAVGGAETAKAGAITRYTTAGGGTHFCSVKVFGE
jgi:hypothetical protein